MPISPYMSSLRERIGHDLVLVPAAVVTLFDDAGRLLLARETKTSRWMTIGGALDPGETPGQAAVRECLEETGLVVATTRLLGVFGGVEFTFTYSNGDVVSYVVTAFEVRRIGGELQPDGVEVSELRFVSREEFPSLEMSRASWIVISRAFERRAEPYFDPA